MRYVTFAVTLLLISGCAIVDIGQATHREWSRDGATEQDLARDRRTCLRGAQLVIDPCILRAWPGFEIVFRYRSARYEVVVENPQKVSRGVASVEVDGAALGGDFTIALADDGNTHRVRIVLG